MTATIRKQIQRAHLKHNGGKRLDLYLTKEEGETLEAFRVARGLRTATDAVKALIEPHMAKPGEPVF
jgi:hypothetical protein